MVPVCFSYIRKRAVTTIERITIKLAKLRGLGFNPKAVVIGRELERSLYTDEGLAKSIDLADALDIEVIQYPGEDWGVVV